jgi:hypothetical protein
MGVRETGALCVEDEKRQRQEYLFKEIEFMVGHKVELPDIEL